MLEAHRIRQRTEYDLEMMQELGFCNGIENYSRILDGRPPGSAPFTLLDYFPSDFVVFVDESHQTVPQIGGMYEGDRSRKQTLVDFGFRLPSALDNRPLRFDEFLAKVPQMVFVSATPGGWELRHSTRVAEQLIRPTGIVDPEVELRPTRNQIDDLLNEIRRREQVGERTLVTTLTKKMAEDLTDYLLEAGVRARYLHSEIDTLERIHIIRDLRLGEYDVLVGVNLLPEGLDLPEVSLVAILDADKEGFLRGQTALIQTIGRAARNINGKVLMYADKHTEAISLRAPGDAAAPRQAARLQRRARDHPSLDPQGGLGHRRVPHPRRAPRPARLTARASHRGTRPRRAREAHDHPRGGDVCRRRGAPLRVRRQAPRRDQGAAPRARAGGARTRLELALDRRGRVLRVGSGRRRSQVAAPARKHARGGELERGRVPEERLDLDRRRLDRVGEGAAGLPLAPRPRTPEPGSRGDDDARTLEPELPVERDGGLVDVPGDDQLGAGGGQRRQHRGARRQRALARAPRRPHHLVVERGDAAVARIALAEPAGRPRELAAPDPATLVVERSGRVEPDHPQPGRDVQRLGRAPDTLELAPGAHQPGDGKVGEVVVAGDDEQRTVEAAQEHGGLIHADRGCRGG